MPQFCATRRTYSAALIANRTGITNTVKIEAFHPASYLPELNPDGLLDADLKQRVTSAVPARNKIALTSKAVGALHSTEKLPQRVETYCRQKDVCYAARPCERTRPAAPHPRPHWRAADNVRIWNLLYMMRHLGNHCSILCRNGSHISTQAA